MIKNLTILITGALIGIAVASSRGNEKQVRKGLDFIAESIKDYSDDVKKIILKTVESLELKETEEIKLNFERLYDFIKENLSELVNLEIDIERKNNPNKKSKEKNKDEK